MPNIDPVARLRRLEELRRAGITVGPESLSDGLEGSATPVDADPMVTDPPAETEPVDPALAENAWANSPYVVRQKMRRLAKAAGVSLEEAQGMVSSTGPGVNGEVDARGQATATERAAQFAPLIDAAASARDASEMDRMKRWKSQMMLASSNSRANMSNAFEMLSPEQKQRVIESRLTGNRYNNNGDPRMAIAQLEAETRRAEGQDARASAAEIAEANRVAAREEREAARASDERRFTAQQQQSQQQNEKVLKQMENQQALLVKQIENGQTTAAADTAVKIKNLEAEIVKSNNQMQTLLANNTANNASAERVAQINADVLRDKTTEATRVRSEDLERAEKLKREEAMVQQFGPGATNIASGDYETPAAQDSLASAAEQADRSLSGFYHSDADRLDAILAQLGVTDPATRSRLVQQYGLDPQAAFGHGGRSGPISGFVNWMYGPRSSNR